MRTFKKESSKSNYVDKKKTNWKKKPDVDVHIKKLYFCEPKSETDINYNAYFGNSLIKWPSILTKPVVQHSNGKSLLIFKILKY